MNKVVQGSRDDFFNVVVVNVFSERNVECYLLTALSIRQ